MLGRSKTSNVFTAYIVVIISSSTILHHAECFDILLLYVYMLRYRKLRRVGRIEENCSYSMQDKEISSRDSVQLPVQALPPHL